jgi:predicted  nucleic acid-binding Zn-ribbon protein
MGNLLSKKRSYAKLNDYAHKYAGYDPEFDNSKFNNDIIDLKQHMNSMMSEFNQKILYLRNKIVDLEEDINNKDTIIDKLNNDKENLEIHLNALSELLDNKFDIVNKDLESLLNNDKLLLTRIEELHPEISESDHISKKSNLDIIKNSFLESNTEYSSFINEH